MTQETGTPPQKPSAETPPSKTEMKVSQTKSAASPKTPQRMKLYLFLASCIASLLYMGCNDQNKEKKSVNDGDEISLINCYALNNKSTATEQIFVSIVFTFKNEGNKSKKLDEDLLQINPEKFNIDYVENTNILDDSFLSFEEIITPKSTDTLDLSPGLVITSILELPSFENMKYYPAGKYKVYLKNHPKCFAYFEKLESGYIINID